MKTKDEILRFLGFGGVDPGHLEKASEQVSTYVRSIGAQRKTGEMHSLLWWAEETVIAFYITGRVVHRSHVKEYDIEFPELGKMQAADVLLWLAGLRRKATPSRGLS